MHWKRSRHGYQSTQGSSISGANTAALQMKMDAKNAVASYWAFRPANGAWRRRGLNLEKGISGKHWECKENPTQPKPFLSSARWRMRSKRGPASVTGLTHENEMFPKIKKGRSRWGEGEECAEQAGIQGNCWIKRLAVIPPTPPTLLPKAIGFIPKHAELQATNHPCKHTRNATVWKQKHWKKKKRGIKMDQRIVLNNPVNLSLCGCCRTCLQLQLSRLSYRKTVWWKYVSPRLLAGNDNTPKAPP